MQPPHPVFGNECPVSDLLFGLSSLIDSEGRPLGERRAPSAVKAGVEITLKECPYRDSRRDQPMNVSALAQVTAHLDPVLDDLTRFRGAQPLSTASTWSGVMTAVVDQLFAPGRFLVTAGGVVSGLPAVAAVAHKLAAGYFGMVYEVLRRQECGTQVVFTTQSFLEHIAATRALHGASEVCAGPPAMIAKVTEVLLGGYPSGINSEAFTQRRTVAELLTKQLLEGLRYQVLDAALERALFEILGACPTARNHFIRERYTSRHAELREQNTPQSTAATLLEGRMSPAVSALERYLRDGAGAILAGDEQIPAILSVASALLCEYERTVASQKKLERELRGTLGLPSETLRSRNALILPLSNTGRWLEALSGASLRYAANLSLTLHRVREPGVNLTPNLCTNAA